MRWTSTCQLVALLAATAGCGEPDAARMAAGTEVGGRAWHVDAGAVLQLGGAESPPLGDVRAATRLPSGEVVIADSRSAELRWFDCRGRLLRTVGGERGGGVSFTSVEGMWPSDGGELLVWDPFELRVSTLTPDGRLLSSRHFPADRLDLFPRLSGIFSDGSLLLQSSDDMTFVVSAEPRREPLLLLRDSFETGGLDTLREELGVERLTWGDAAGAVRKPVPMGHRTVVGVHGDRFWVADSQERTVRSYDARSGVTATINLAGQSRRLSEAEREDYRARFLAAARQAGGRRAAEHFAANLKIPATTLPFSDLHVDRAGNAWLRQGDPATPDRWMVIDPNGRRLGAVALPPGLDVLEIGDDYVLGRGRDAAGREHIRVHRLRK